MAIDNVIEWYNKNVNYKISKAFLDFLIKIGIINKNIDLNLLNMFLLECYGDYYVKENDKYKIKENRKQIIDKFNIKKEDVVISSTVKKQNKFKIESLGGKKLKLVKL